VNKFILRVDDVGRLSTDDPETGSDKALDNFFCWYEYCGLKDLPALYGVVPTWLNSEGLKRFKSEIPRRYRAVHGWDHVKGAAVLPCEFKAARKMIGGNVYIPPYNQYSKLELQRWKAVGGKYLMGGFNEEHHKYGPTARSIWGVTHVPAIPELYGKSPEIIHALETLPEHDHPLVVTLHVPWEVNWTYTRALIDLIRNSLVSLEQAYGSA
jgi:hypothetical protein